MTFSGDTALEVGSELARADLSDRASFNAAVEAVKKYARAKMKKSKSSAVALPGGKLEALERSYAHLGYHDVFYLARLELNFPASAIHLPRPSSPVRRRLVAAGFELPESYKLPGPVVSSNASVSGMSVRSNTSSTTPARNTSAPSTSKAANRSAMRMHGALLAPETPKPVKGPTAPLDLDSPPLAPVVMPEPPVLPEIVSTPIPIGTPNDARYTRPEKSAPPPESGPPPIPPPPQRHSSSLSGKGAPSITSAPSVYSVSGHSVRSVTPEDADTHIRALFNALPPEAQALAFHRLAAMQASSKSNKEGQSGEQQNLQAARAAAEALEEAEIAEKKAMEEKFERDWQRKKDEELAKEREWARKREEERKVEEAKQREREREREREIELERERERERVRQLELELEQARQRQKEQELRERVRQRDREREREQGAHNWDHGPARQRSHELPPSRRESSIYHAVGRAHHHSPQLPSLASRPSTASNSPASPPHLGNHTFGNSPASPPVPLPGSAGAGSQFNSMSVSPGSPLVLPSVAFPHPPRRGSNGLPLSSSPVARQPPAGRPPAPPGPATRAGDGEDVRRVLEARIRALQHALADLNIEGGPNAVAFTPGVSRKGSVSTQGSSRRGSGPGHERHDSRRQGSVPSIDRERRQGSTSSNASIPPLTNSSAVEVPMPRTPAPAEELGLAMSLAEAPFFVPRQRKTGIDSPEEMETESPPPGYDSVAMRW